MQNKKIIQVLPSLRPGKCGISDHAILLADTLMRKCEIDTLFVASSVNTESNINYPVICCDVSSLTAICVAEKSELCLFVLIHLSGYGYSADGAPHQLRDSINYLRMHCRVKIMVYFHELFYMDWAPWRKSFWLSFKQKKVIQDICKISNMSATSTSLYSRHIRKYNRNKLRENVNVVSVFSTIGECDGYIPLAESRENSLVVFGLEASRKRAYKMLKKDINIIEHLHVDRIYDVGPGCVQHEWRNIAVKEICAMGMLSAAKVSTLLKMVRYGFVPCSNIYAGKSSVMAACCSHGVIPVLPKLFNEPCDGIVSDYNALGQKHECDDLSSHANSLSVHARLWYLSHNVAEHAKLYLEFMRLEKL